ncbi:hypothetical protein [Saccharopolyspora endophytica]|uniref:ArsR family transcriptional regulator n=1 Tax=Saccharopolyspora endophytica TaxID=543886 RepID=A0ABS5DA00_9PSEU|nr:hypothetical protein [Saccharopolyspora endophytica]MBQ0923125.1 hypothetical protein [Saccharopolyspora endophytica]
MAALESERSAGSEPAAEPSGGRLRYGGHLAEAAELGSTGRLYHHLKSLTATNLVEQDKRGSYRLRPKAAIPALVLLTAASDVADQLR